MDESKENSSLFLGGKMRIICILSLFVLISCAGDNQVVPQIKVMEEKQQIYSQSYGSGSINGFLLKLERSSEGKCILSYKKESEEAAEEEKITLDMDAPCEFVRLPNARIRSYAYGEKDKRYTAVIIVGIKPDPNKKDSPTTGGCGTEFIAVSVFKDKIKTAKKVESDSPICPSEGLDEKYFGIYAEP